MLFVQQTVEAFCIPATIPRAGSSVMKIISSLKTLPAWWRRVTSELVSNCSRESVSPESVGTHQRDVGLGGVE